MNNIQGYNDNNFNRKIFPSNIFPPNNGYPGNPFDRFNPNTHNPLTGKATFIDAFKKHEPMIEKITYNNPNDLLHNNIGDVVLDEHIVEYRLNIDSLDRDISVYPDPFHFVVKFNPTSGGRVTTEVPVDYKNKMKGTKIVETFFKSPPGPYINKEFKNVKYIRLENVILPVHSNIKELDDGSFVFDKSSNLLNDRYVSLAIKELDCYRTYSTNDNSTRAFNHSLITPPKSFAIIIPDKLFGYNFYSGSSFYGNTIFKDSHLGNVKQLSIDFYDSFGVPLHYDDLFTAAEVNDENNDISIDDLRHPLNKKIQVHLSFIIGVVESQINTDPKFEQ